MEPVQVAQQYVRGRFTLDLLVAVPYAWLFIVDAIDGDYDYHSGAGTMVSHTRARARARISACVNASANGRVYARA
eukprot:4129567-Pleurochrysis_carterae.AAC.1